MTEHSLWRFSRALHRALNDRQPEDLATLLDEDVEWTIYGPIDMFPFLGGRRGKAAVLELSDRLPIISGSIASTASRSCWESIRPHRCCAIH